MNNHLNFKIRHSLSVIFNQICLHDNVLTTYSHPQTDLFHSIRTQQCGWTVSFRSWDRNPVDSNTKPKILTIQPRGAIICVVNFKQL